MENGNDLLALTEGSLGAYGFTVEQIGTYQKFDAKKRRIKEYLEAIGDGDAEILSRHEVLDIILENRQKLCFYLEKKDDGSYGLPDNMNPADPDTYETLMLFDELASVLEDILMRSRQHDGGMELEGALASFMEEMNRRTYERLDLLLGCLMTITER